MQNNLLDRNQIAAILKAQRKAKEIKQTTVAKEIKVNDSYISKLENGKIIIAAAMLFNYCSAIDMTAADFINAFKDFF